MFLMPETNQIVTKTIKQLLNKAKFISLTTDSSVQALNRTHLQTGFHWVWDFFLIFFFTCFLREEAFCEKGLFALELSRIFTGKVNPFR